MGVIRIRWKKVSNDIITIGGGVNSTGGSTWCVSKDLQNDRDTTARKKWGRPPTDQSNISLKFCRVYTQFWNPHPSIICGYLKISFNHGNIKFKYIYRFTFTDCCVINKLIFS